MNSSRNSVSPMPCGWSLRPGQRHQVDHVDHADPQLGQPLAQDLRGRDGLHGRRRRRRRPARCRARACRRRCRPTPRSPAPRAQCSTASSIVSHCSCGCLSMTIRFTYELSGSSGRPPTAGSWRPAAGRPGRRRRAG